MKRIGEEGSLNLDSGNWKSVSAQAKVQYINSIGLSVANKIVFCWGRNSSKKKLKFVQKIDIIDALYYDAELYKLLKCRRWKISNFKIKMELCSGKDLEIIQLHFLTKRTE